MARGIPFLRLGERNYRHTSSGTAGQVLTSNGPDTDPTYEDPATGPDSGGRLLGVQTITATGGGTYTPTAGTSWIVLELQGAGGGGAGRASPGTSNVAVGGGGSGGAWLRKRLTANFSGASYSIGTGGGGGAAGNNNGSAGGDTTFTDTAGSPTTYTAGGGSGGGGTSGTPTQVVGPLLGGTATNGDVNVTGGISYTSVGYPGPFFATGGNGGASRYSPGAIGGYVAANPGSTAGVTASGKGGGGSGCAITGTGSAAAGGSGSDGLIIVWEYS